jgi:hypothetical protein
MSKYNLTSMFDSIKEALTSQDNKQGGLQDILQLKPGNTYTVRLLPNTKNPKQSLFHHFTHGWNSLASGKYVSAISPTTFGERDPIAEERYKVLRTGTEEEKDKMKAIRRAEQWLVNVYVIDDPSKPENNGKVKILRYGKQLGNIINSAISGDEAEEFGMRVFDLSKEGVNFKIKVEKQGDYPVYTSSRFTSVGKDLGLSGTKQDEILETTHDLENVFRVKTEDELKQMLDEHFYCKSADDRETSTSLPEADEAIAELSNKVKQPTVVSSSIEDADIDELLKDL